MRGQGGAEDGTVVGAEGADEDEAFGLAVGATVMTVALTAARGLAEAEPAGGAIYHARFKMTGSRAGQGWRRRRTPMRGWRRTGSSRDRWFSAQTHVCQRDWWVDE